MNDKVSYNDKVRQRFANPRRVGVLQGAFDQTLMADASEAENGARVQLTAGIRDGRIAGTAFKAWGCPHLIAAADLACEQMSGKPVEYLEKPDLAHITGELGVPAEKAGRILLLEDALTALWAQHAVD